MSSSPLRNALQTLCWAFVLTTSFFCAGQIAPSGGPPDTTPPEIIATEPLPGSLNIHRGRIVLAFSKYVDHASVAGSLFISPSVGEMSVDWSGTEVELRFSDSLRPNTTYILTVGTDVTDTRKNKMAKAFALPFSTGPSIDSARVSGRVFDTAPSGIMIFAYTLMGPSGDTLNPSHTTPDYETQTGKDGSFNLTNLATGRYRLIAVRDEYRNLLYDRQTDEFGMAPGDFTLDSAKMKISGVQFRMTKEDTTRPFLSSARAQDRSHVRLRFSEAMDTTGIRSGNVSVLDTLSGAPLRVADFSFTSEPALEGQAFTDDQDPSKTYRVVLSGMKDNHGNPLNSAAGSALFGGSAAADTTRPVMTLEGIQQGAKDIPIEDSIRLSFSEAVERTGVEHGFRLSDSSRAQTHGSFKWWGSARAAFIPSAPLVMGMPYTLSVQLDSIRDFAGHASADTPWTRKFRTVDDKMVSSIKGRVEDDSASGAGRIYLIATNISAKESRPVRTTIESPGEFLLERIVEGKYTISGFRDADSDGVYTYGSPYPYHPSERFTVYQDTLKVRARWPLEGVLLRFR